MIITYDVSNRDSFSQLKYWIEDIERYCPRVPKIIVAAKSDSKIREVTTIQGSEFAAAVNLGFLECSAKEGINVQEVFVQLMRKIIEASDTTGSAKTNSTSLQILEQRTLIVKKKSCSIL